MLALLSVDTGIFFVHVECDAMRAVEYFEDVWTLVKNQFLMLTVWMGTADLSV